MLPEIKNILYTTNLEQNTRSVLKFAVSLAKSLNAKLFLLHVVEPLSYSDSFLIEAYLSTEMMQQAKEITKQLRQETSQRVLDKIKSRIEQFSEDEFGATSEQLKFIADIRVVSGSPAETIVQEAQDQNMDLIIVGSQAGSSLKTAFLGSTAHKVTLMAKKPVLAVPMQETAGWGD